MTSFIAWRAGPQKRPGSLYFASDSRRSWKNGETRDDCIKLFAPATSPDIFGMLGEDITLPEMVLPKLCDSIDAGILNPGLSTSAYGRNEWVAEEFRRCLLNAQQHGSFSVFHGSRNGFGAHATFVVFLLQYFGSEGRFSNTEIILPEEGSCAIALKGTGESSLSENVTPWTLELGDYSRSYFSGFCDALESGMDRFSGGAPQLLALGNSGKPIHLGVVTSKGRFFRGHLITSPSADIKWRNELFECVDVHGRLLHDAQKQPRPRKLRNTKA